MADNSGIGKLVRPIFSPAITLLNRMGFTRKFVLLWLVSAVAVAVVVTGLFISLDQGVQVKQQELQGLTLIEPVSQTVQLIQRRRGISVGLLSGHEAMKDRLAAQEKEAADAFNAIEAKLPVRLASSEDFLNIKAAWQRLSKEGLHQTAEENFAAHTRLIGQIQLFEELITDDYALVSDRDIATSYLIDATIHKFPHALEHLGQLRAYGTGILVKKQITEHQKIKLNNMIAELRSVLYELLINIEKTGHYSPAVLESLDAAYAGIENSSQQIIDLVETDILGGNFVTPAEDFFDMSTAAIDRGYAQMHRVLLPAVRNLIETRIDKAEYTLYLSVGGALLLLIMMVYISISIYYAIIGSIKSLVHSAHAFAEGDLNQRVKLDAHDELSLIGDSFNVMIAARKQAEEKLRLTQFVSDQAPECIFWSDEQARIHYVNEAACRELGYTKEELLATSVPDIDPDFPAAAWPAHWQELKQKKHLTLETRHRRKDGSIFPVEITLNFVKFGNIEYNIAYSRNITERKQHQMQLEASRKHFENVFNSSNDGIFILNMQGSFIDINRSAHERLGYSKEEMLALKITELDPPEFAVRVPERFAQIMEQGNAVFETAHYRKNGSTMPVEISARVIELDGEEMFLSIVRDITERKQAEENINLLAFYDTLTNLPNRRLLLDRLHQATAVSTRSGRHGAVLFLDLDNFKTINDTQGHTAGDRVLVEVARRLQDSVREGDSVARLGGDEFVVVLEELSAQQDDAVNQAELVAEKIRDELTRPYRLEDYDYYTSASTGICLFLDHLKSVEDLLKHADVAMYQAKQAGRNTIRFFDPLMQAALDKRASIEADLRQALARQQFRQHYQVQVDSRGKATGAEVLLRWEHPQRGFVFPDQFIPLAEETGLIVSIGLWVLEAACAQLKAWQNDTLTRDLTLAVNVSARQFHQADFVAQVQRVLLESGAKPSHLKLELTESTVLENIQDTIARMREIKLLGVYFSMDDFGTGYSSLQYLKRLPLDQVKIDRSFVSDITSDPDDAAIVQAIIAMTDALGLNVIAEGVETEAQRDFLIEHGCHAFQGYLFSKPVAVEEFEALLRQG